VSPRLGIWLVLSLAGLAYAILVYRRREMRVSSWPLLAGLRAASIATILLLLVDLELPGTGEPLPEWLVLDVSPSMAFGGGIEAAGATVTSQPQSGPRITFGAPVRVVNPGTPVDSIPDAVDSRLAPAIVRALETGASRLTVITDLRITDPVETAATLRSTPIPVEVIDVGGPLVNAGVSDLVLPATAPADEDVEGTVGLFIEGADSVRLTLRQGGEAGPVLLDTLIFPGTQGAEAGRADRIPVRLSGLQGTGPIGITASVSAPNDAYAPDDARTQVVDVDPAEGRLVLVSWTPDWEPRFLLPVLGQVTGLPTGGYLRIGEDQFLSFVGEPRVVSLEEVVVAVDDARLAVLHQLPAGASPELEAASRRAPRVLRFTEGGTGGVQGGEWYATPDLPSSPVAGELAGLALAGVPPLTSRVTPPDDPGMRVLEIQRGGSGEPVPALTLSEGAGRREATVWASGFWRWGFREGEARELYRRLWSGVAGWLLAGGDLGTRQVGLAPTSTVVVPGARLPWRAGPAAGGRIAVAMAADSVGSEALSTDTVAVDSLGRAALIAPESSGRYRWTAEVVEGPGEGRVRSGLLVVEEPALDLQHARAVSLLDAVGGTETVAAAAGRPLRTHPAPYLFLVILLAAEWLGRRRIGLR
jgi:hypothetical protein